MIGGLFDAEDCADIHVVERGRRAGFPEKSLSRARRLGHYFGKKLESDCTLEILIDGAVYDAHAAASYPSHNAILTRVLGALTQIERQVGQRRIIWSH